MIESNLISYSFKSLNNPLVQVLVHINLFRLLNPKTSQDFSASHPDDIDWEEDDCSTASTLDTLSEISTQPSLPSIIQPQSKRDLALKRVDEQRVDWEGSNHFAKKSEDELAALTLLFKNAMALEKKKEPAVELPKKDEKKPPEVPAHVSCFESCKFFIPRDPLTKSLNASWGKVIKLCLFET